MKKQQMLSEIIKNKRNELKLSQKDLAEKLGYKDASSLAKIETGKIKIPKDKVGTFAAVLGSDSEILTEAATFKDAVPLKRKHTRKTEAEKTVEVVPLDINKNRLNSGEEEKQKQMFLDDKPTIENVAETISAELPNEEILEPVEVQVSVVESGLNKIEEKKIALKKLKRKIVDEQLMTFSEEEFDKLGKYIDFIIFSRKN